MSQSTDDRPRKMLGARVDPELHRRVRVAAAKQDTDMATYLRGLLDEHVPDE